MYRTRWLASFIAGVAFVGCTAAEVGPAIDDARVRQELTDQMAAYTRAILAGDAEVMIGLWTEDGTILEPGMELRGGELREFIRESFGAGQVRVLSLDMRPRDQFVHGDAAYEVGEFDQVSEIAGEEQEAHFYYFMRWEKGVDGVWRMDQFVAGPREMPLGM